MNIIYQWEKKLLEVYEDLIDTRKVTFKDLYMFHRSVNRRLQYVGLPDLGVELNRNKTHYLGIEE